MPLFIRPLENRLRRDVPLVNVSGQDYSVNAGERFLPESVQLFHNGRRLRRSDFTAPLGDYELLESRGANTGFDTIRLLVSVNPGALFMDYILY